MLVDVIKCPVCGYDHVDIVALKFTEAKTVQGQACSRYVICPIKKTTIYLSDRDGAKLLLEEKT